MGSNPISASANWTQQQQVSLSSRVGPETFPPVEPQEMTAVQVFVQAGVSYVRLNKH